MSVRYGRISSSRKPRKGATPNRAVKSDVRLPTTLPTLEQRRLARIPKVLRNKFVRVAVYASPLGPLIKGLEELNKRHYRNLGEGARKEGYIAGEPTARRIPLLKKTKKRRRLYTI